jgi:AraC-like DNA-binding protein
VDEQFLVGHDILLDRLPHRAQAMEQILLIARLSFSEISGGRARPRSVRFRHQRISSPRVYRSYFGCDVAFGQRDDALVFDKHLLACPTEKHDAAALQAAIEQLEAGPFARTAFGASVRAAVMHRLGTSECTVLQVAGSLCLHARAMHRKLAAEGTSFQRIKNEVRRDLALFLLENTSFQLSRISERLGFAEQSTLTHFCRKWFREAPSALRIRATRSGSP